MGRQTPSPEEYARAQELAGQLKLKMEKYFPEPHDPTRIAELQARRTEIEKLGFRVAYNLSLNVTTLACVVEITLTPL